MYLEVFLIIFSVCVLVLVIFCIPILNNIWKTTKNVAVTLETLNQSLPSILKNLQEITTNINNSTTAVNREVQNFTGTVNRFNVIIKDVADDIGHIAPVAVNSPFFQTLKNIIAVIKGIRVFLDAYTAKR